MHYFKRLLSVTLWVAISFLLLSWPKFFQKDDAKILHILGWADCFDDNTIETFEEKHQVKVRIHSYGSNEEMLTKMKATKGKGYDLIIPSDYAVPLLKEEGLIKELDHEKLPFFSKLNPKLLGHDYDPENRYAIPLQWVVYGFGIDRDAYNENAFTYEHIFHSDKRVVMVNNPVDVINLAAFYLYGPVKNLTPEQVNEIKQLLLDQKETVEAYVDVRADYLLATRNCSLAFSQHYYLWLMENEAAHVKFVLPEGPLFASIENLVIPQKSEKDPLTYAFINHVYKRENLINQCNAWYNLPPTDEIADELEYAERYRWLKKELERRGDKPFYFFRHLIPEEESRKLWIEIKS